MVVAFSMSQSTSNPSNEADWEPKVNPQELKKEMDAGYARIIDFIVTPEFKSVVEEMESLHPEQKPDFVKEVLLNEEELEKRGVSLPDDLYIMRSSFGDRRPTLFVVKYYLPERYHAYWDNVNMTFDESEDLVDVEVQTGSKAWQLPLAPELERLVLSGRVSREVIEESLNDPMLEAIVGVEDERTS